MSGNPLQQAIVRKRAEESVSMSPGVDQEARIQNVEAIASATSQMTMEQLRAFHQQHHALVTDVIAKQTAHRAIAISKPIECATKYLDEKLLAQERTTQSHDKALLHAIRAFGDTARSLQELKSDLEMTKRRVNCCCFQSHRCSRKCVKGRCVNGKLV
jgi:hypothetical protein